MEAAQRKTFITLALIIGGALFACCAVSAVFLSVGVSALDRFDAGFANDLDDPLAFTDELDAGLEEQRGVFATQMLALLNAERDGGFVYVAANDALENDAGAVMVLGNLFAEWRLLSASEREVWMREVSRTPFTSSMPQTWAEAQTRVLPSIRDEVFLSLAPNGGALVHGRVAAELVWVLVVDGERGMQFIDAATLARWGVSLQQAQAQALDNLRERSTTSLAQVAPHVYRSPFHDNYDPSRLLLSGTFEGLELHGAPVVFVPNRDTLLVTGADDSDGLQAAAALVDEAMQRPRPMTGRAWVRRAAQWEPFLPSPKSPAFAALQALSVQATVDDATEQKQALEERFARDGSDLFVASLKSLRPERSNTVLTYCVWTKGAVSLLPKSDFIAFIDLDKPQDHQMVAMASWSAVQRALGKALTLDTTYHPARAHVTAFPSEKVIKSLGVDPLFAR